MRMRLVAAVLTGTVLVGCTGQTAPPSAPMSPGPTSASSQPAPSGTPAPQQSSPTGRVPQDAAAALEVSPVDYGDSTLVRATFGASHRAKGRPIALQRQTDSGWQEVASAKMTGAGSVEFLALGTGGTFRAVALPAGKARDAVATPTAKAADQWNRVLNSGFDGSSLPQPWDYRLTDIYDAGGRWCSAPRKGNVEVAGGTITLSMSKASKAVTARVNASAKRKQAQAGQKTVGCPEGVFDNAMVSTQDRFTVPSGMVAARVKFPSEPGAHASVWLQSDAAQELDMIETFGYGRGITNVIHVRGTKHPADGAQSYVATDPVADPQWWEAWHTVSVEWDRSGVRFRLDGKLTRELKVALAPANYYVVISLLSSDWETYRLTKPDARPGSGVDAASVPKPKLPFTMDVDWVRAWRTR